jgi:hypothetical protein
MFIEPHPYIIEKAFPKCFRKVLYIAFTYLINELKLSLYLLDLVVVIALNGIKAFFLL